MLSASKGNGGDTTQYNKLKMNGTNQFTAAFCSSFLQIYFQLLDTKINFFYTFEKRKKK